MRGVRRREGEEDKRMDWTKNKTYFVRVELIVILYRCTVYVDSLIMIPCTCLNVIESYFIILQMERTLSPL